MINRRSFVATVLGLIGMRSLRKNGDGLKSDNGQELDTIRDCRIRIGIHSSSSSCEPSSPKHGLWLSGGEWSDVPVSNHRPSRESYYRDLVRT